IGFSDLELGVYLVIAIFVLIVATYALLISEIKDLQIEIIDLKGHISTLEDIKKKVEDIKASNKELREKITIIKLLEENRTRPLFMMEILGQAIPNRAWIDRYLEKNSSALIEGVAWDELTVSNFITNLESFPYFRNVGLSVIKAKEVKGLPLKAFVIETNLNYQINTTAEDKLQ
ncbi:MAG TPA: PilN domain-containing protein, partial [Thermodesulfobacteriota bacterium]